MSFQHCTTKNSPTGLRQHITDSGETLEGGLTLVIISENGGKVCHVETESIVITLLGSRVDLWPINSDYRLIIQ